MATPKLAVLLMLIGLLGPTSFGQEKVGSNAHIDMYFGNWQTAPARTTHGGLKERDILTRGDPFNPTTKGAVLRYINAFTYAILAPGESTVETRPEGKQEIYYFVSGQGIVNASGTQANVSPNIAVLIPAGLSYTIRNSGPSPLSMYLITEPVQAAFTPNTKMLVRDENTIPIASSHEEWARIVKPVFVKSDGLSTLDQVSVVELDALTLGKPFIGTDNNLEEVWTALSGTSIAWMGPFLRRQTPGMSYLHPPDNLAPTTNINYSEDNQVTFLYFVSHGVEEPQQQQEK